MSLFYTLKTRAWYIMHSNFQNGSVLKEIFGKRKSNVAESRKFQVLTQLYVFLVFHGSETNNNIFYELWERSHSQKKVLLESHNFSPLSPSLKILSESKQHRGLKKYKISQVRKIRTNSPQSTSSKDVLNFIEVCLTML